MPYRLIRRANGKMLAAALVGALVAWFGIVGYITLDIKHRTDRTATALVALCALRADLDARIATSQGLLDAHPHAQKIAGFNRTLFVNNVANSKRTRKALSILDCKGVNP